MAIGTAIIALGIFYLLIISKGFRMVLLGGVALCAVGIWWLAVQGADKPQTMFYNSSAHPAFLLKAGDVCPPDRHVWNGWCVK